MTSIGWSLLNAFILETIPSFASNSWGKGFRDSCYYKLLG
ncbi:BnaC03g29540D [Brassica napus]|uniref:BnaC03g29540D protein n=1 Tax=Brassica napus TaxID=3708 RepID=A0A078G467_BRANA|nr:BnaC03g29540D [Brassica napus]